MKRQALAAIAVLLVVPAAHAGGAHFAHVFNHTALEHDAFAFMFGIAEDEWADNGWPPPVGGPFTQVLISYGDGVGAGLSTAVLYRIEATGPRPVAFAASEHIDISHVETGDPRALEYLLIVATDAPSVDHPPRLTLEYGRAAASDEVALSPLASGSGARIGLARISCSFAGQVVAPSPCTRATHGEAADDLQPVLRHVEARVAVESSVPMFAIATLHSSSGEVEFTAGDGSGQLGTLTSSGSISSCASDRWFASAEATRPIGLGSEDVHLGGALLPLPAAGLGLC